MTEQLNQKDLELLKSFILREYHDFGSKDLMWVNEHLDKILDLMKSFNHITINSYSNMGYLLRSLVFDKRPFGEKYEPCKIILNLNDNSIIKDMVGNN